MRIRVTSNPADRSELERLSYHEGDTVVVIADRKKKFKVYAVGMKTLRVYNVDDPTEKLLVYKRDCVKGT